MGIYNRTIKNQFRNTKKLEIMGRHYEGTINGKFWFGLQASNSADRFGVIGYEPEAIRYNFEEDDLDEVNREIETIEATLGDNKKVIEDFFENKVSYQSKDLEELGITRDILKEYADLLLGIQIRDCIIEQGNCTFDAEL